MGEEQSTAEVIWRIREGQKGTCSVGWAFSSGILSVQTRLELFDDFWDTIDAEASETCPWKGYAVVCDAYQAGKW